VVALRRSLESAPSRWGQAKSSFSTPEDLEFAEDLLYTAAVQAGWLAGQPDEVVDVPDVQITVAVTRRSQPDRHL
jgi:hypothetical protein